MFSITSEALATLIFEVPRRVQAHPDHSAGADHSTSRAVIERVLDELGIAVIDGSSAARRNATLVRVVNVNNCNAAADHRRRLLAAEVQVAGYRRRHLDDQATIRRLRARTRQLENDLVRGSRSLHAVPDEVSDARRPESDREGETVTADLEVCSDLTVIKASGEIDVDGSETLRHAGEQALREPACRHLLLDLSAVTFMDCSGISALLALRNAAADRGASFTLHDLAHPVRRLLHIAGLEDAFDIRCGDTRAG